MLNMTPYGVGYPFGHLGSDVLAMSPLNFLSTPNLLTGGVGRVAENTLMLWKHCWSPNKNIPVLSTLFWSQIQNTAPNQVLWKKQKHLYLSYSQHNYLEKNLKNL